MIQLTTHRPKHQQEVERNDTEKTLKINLAHLKNTKLNRKIIFHPPPFLGVQHVNSPRCVLLMIRYLRDLHHPRPSTVPEKPTPGEESKSNQSNSLGWFLWSKMFRNGGYRLNIINATSIHGFSPNEIYHPPKWISEGKYWNIWKYSMYTNKFLMYTPSQRIHGTNGIFT